MMCWMEQRRRAARRRRLLRALYVMLALCAAASATGLMLPSEHRTIVRGSLDGSPEAVWRVLTDLDGMPMWRSDVTRVERLPDAGGRTTWREVGRQGEVIVELAESEPPHLLVTNHREAGRPVLPELTFQLTARGRGTSITLIERSQIGNPLLRVLVRLGARSSTAAGLLRDLEERLNANRRQMAADGAPRDGN